MTPEKISTHSGRQRYGDSAGKVTAAAIASR